MWRMSTIASFLAKYRQLLAGVIKRYHMYILQFNCDCFRSRCQRCEAKFDVVQSWIQSKANWIILSLQTITHKIFPIEISQFEPAQLLSYRITVPWGSHYQYWTSHQPHVCVITIKKSLSSVLTSLYRLTFIISHFFTLNRPQQPYFLKAKWYAMSQ